MSGPADERTMPFKSATFSGHGVFVSVLCCISATILCHWDSLVACHRPLHIWLFGACGIAGGFGLALCIGGRAESCEPWWFVRPRTRVSRVAFILTWACLLPLMAFWTALGASWLSETLNESPDCLPSDPYPIPTLLALCQVICGLWVVGYAIFVANIWAAARCIQANAAAILSVEDTDLVNRWGEQTPSANLDLSGGLLPEELDLAGVCHDVSARFVRGIGSGTGDCAVCLYPCKARERVRLLSACGHVFHRPCIDLWLLRNARCPLCNAGVQRVPEPVKDWHQISDLFRRLVATPLRLLRL